MIADGQTIWLARAGERGYALTDCVAADVVALRHASVGDARDLTVEEIAANIDTAATPTKAAMAAGMLSRFVNDVAVGDVVITTHLETRSVYFGEVTGEYRFADPSPVPGFEHLRAVKWFGRLNRDTDLPKERRSDVDKQPTFYELADQDYWLERSEAARAATSALKPPRRSAAPKEEQVGGIEVPTPTQVCNSCGLRKPSGIITDGVCRDCE